MPFNTTMGQGSLLKTETVKTVLRTLTAPGGTTSATIQILTDTTTTWTQALRRRELFGQHGGANTTA